MEHIDRLERLLKEHSYQALSPEDRLWVSQYISSEEEYDSLRRSSLLLNEHFSSAGASGQNTPRPEILRSLKQQWKQNRQPVSRGILNRSVPGYAFALSLLVVGVASWYGGFSQRAEPRYIDRTLTQHDTVRLASKPDTVVIERVVYRQLPVPAPVLTLKNVSTEKPMQNKGVNMKEKEELEKLLVSGGI